MSGTERVHQFEFLVRRRAALSDGLRRGPGQLFGQKRHEPGVCGRVGRHGRGAVHGHRRGRDGVPAMQSDQVAAGRGRPAAAARVPENVRGDRSDDVCCGGPCDALRQAVRGTERRRCARQTVPVFVGRPLPGVQGQHMLTKRRRRRGGRGGRGMPESGNDRLNRSDQPERMSSKLASARRSVN